MNWPDAFDFGIKFLAFIALVWLAVKVIYF